MALCLLSSFFLLQSNFAVSSSQYLRNATLFRWDLITPEFASDSRFFSTIRSPTRLSISGNPCSNYNRPGHSETKIATNRVFGKLVPAASAVVGCLQLNSIASQLVAQVRAQAQYRFRKGQNEIVYKKQREILQLYSFFL